MAHRAGSRSRLTMPSCSHASIVVCACRYGSPPFASCRSTSTTLNGLFAASCARSGGSITSYGGAATASSEPTAARSYRRVRSGWTSAMRAATLALWRARVGQGPGVRLLGHVGEPPGAAAQHDRERDDGNEADRAERDVDRRAELLERLLAVVAEEPEDRGPHDAARGVPCEEALPLHLPDAGEERGIGAQDGDEAAEEDDLAAVPLEHVARDLQVALVDAQLGPVADEQPVAALAADRVADVVADHGARDRRRDHVLDQEVPGRARVDGGGHEHRLARGGDAEALDGDDREHGEVAEVREEVVDYGCEDRRHGRLAWHALGRRSCRGARTARAARVLEQLPGVDLGRHVLRLRAVGRAVLELDHRQKLLAAHPDHVLPAAAGQYRLLDDLVVDALVV